MADRPSVFSGVWHLAIFLILSTLMMAISIVIVVSMNDYVYYQFYEVADYLVTTGMLSSSVLTSLEELATNAVGVIQYFDIVWAAVFVLFVVDYLKNAYYAKREGLFSIFGFLCFGVMASLFILSLVVTYNQTLYNVFFVELLENVTVNLTFFDFYVANFQIINLILIVSGIIANLVSLDLDVFRRRKEAETEEEVTQ